MKGQALSMQLGFSHDVDIPPPAGITFAVPKQTEIKHLRHRQAAGRRDRRPDPPYPSAGALQGQGRALRRRKGPPQGRQEEVSHGALSSRHPPSAAPSAPARASSKLANGRPRLSVFRSSKNIYAQVIDDERGVTLAAASSLEGGKAKAKGSDKDAAARVGDLVAQRAMEKGVKDVVFDRGGYLYHGRVKALADAAREAGLNF